MSRHRALSRCLVGSLGLVLAACLISSPVWGQLPEPRLDWCYPPGAQVGTQLEVTLGGGDLDEATSLQFSHPGIQAKPKMTEASEFVPAVPVPNVFVVDVATDVPPGVYEVRAIGRFGITNPKRFVVDTLPEVLEAGNQKTLETAQSVDVNSVVNGRAEANSRDYFKLSLQQGQRVLIEAQTESIGSRMIATLELLTIEGKELAKTRGTNGFRSLIDFTAPEEGVYVISIYDFLFAGSPEYFYRLRIHEGPFIDWVEPLVIPPGQPTEVAIIGRLLGDQAKPADRTVNGVALEQATQTILADELPRRGDLAPVAGHGLDLRPLSITVDGRVATTSPVVVSDLAQVDEVEPNDGLQESPPQTLQVPAVVTGRFATPLDADVYQFEATQGQVLVIDLFSQRLGFPVDAFASLAKVVSGENGQEQVTTLQEVDDSGDRGSAIGSDFDLSTDDPTLRFQAPETGTYRLTLTDQFGGTRDDPRIQYVLMIREEQPQVAVLVEPPQGRPGNPNQAVVGTLELRRGGTEALNVRVIRRDGFAGPVEINVRGLPSGVTVEPLTIPPNAGSGMLVLHAAEDCAGWVGEIQVIASYTIQGTTQEQVAETGTLVWGTGNRQVTPAVSRLAPSLALAVVAEDLEPVLVEPVQKQVTTSRGARVEIPVKLHRRSEFNGAVTLAAVGLPGEIKPGQVQFGEGAVDATLTLDLANNNAQPGPYRTLLQGDVKVSRVRNPQAIAAAEARVAQLTTWTQEWQGRLEQAQQTLAGLPEQLTQTQAALTEADQAVVAAQSSLVAQSEAYAAAGKAWETARAELAAGPEDAARQTALNAARETLQERLAALQAAVTATTQAQTQSQQHRERLTALQQQQTDLPATIEMAQAKIARLGELTTQANQQLEQVRKANPAGEVTYTTVSLPVDLEVLPSPLELQAGPLSVMPGNSGEIPLTVTRQFGFADAVQIAVSGPENVPGLTLQGGTLAADQSVFPIPVSTTAETPAGDYSATITATAKFNGVDVSSTLQVTIKVVPST